jgi:hypothetical protein
MTFKYSYIPGFFAQDDLKANPGVIGAVRTLPKTRALKDKKGDQNLLACFFSLQVASAIRFARQPARSLGSLQRKN